MEENELQELLIDTQKEYTICKTSTMKSIKRNTMKNTQTKKFAS